jgi:hypothetical protein
VRGTKAIYMKKEKKKKTIPPASGRRLKEEKYPSNSVPSTRRLAIM